MIIPGQLGGRGAGKIILVGRTISGEWWDLNAYMMKKWKARACKYPDQETKRDEISLTNSSHDEMSKEEMEK